MVSFDFDQQFAANFAFRVIKEFPIQLIGQPLSVEGLFMGPIGFYLFTPFYWITNLHPIGGGIASVLIGLLTIFTYFYVGKKIINPTAGLIAAFLRSISFIELKNDWSAAPLNISEPLVLILWWSLYKYWHQKEKFLPFITLILGLFTSMHPVQFPFYLVFILILLIKRRLPKLKTALISIITFFIPLSPLILFEFLHNFLEIKRLASLFHEPSTQPKDLNLILHYLQFLGREVTRILAINIENRWIIGILVALIIIFLSIKKIGFFKDKFHPIMILITFTAFISYYYILPKGWTEYYFLALTSLIILYLGGLLSLLVKNKITILILILILINISWVNFKNIQSYQNMPLTNLDQKDAIVKKILEIQPKGQEFYVSYISLPGWNFGFDYLFKLYGRIPQTKEVKQPIYTIVIPKSLSPDSIKFSSGNIGLIFPDSKK